MEFFLSVFSSESFYIRLPVGFEWMILAVEIGIAIFLARKWRNLDKLFKGGDKRLLLALLVFQAFAVSFLGLRFPAWNMLPEPGSLNPPAGPVLMLFVFVPVVLAAGWLGPLSASGVALVAGLVMAGWATHHLFTVMEYVLPALVFGSLIQQRYRTWIFGALRHPLVISVFLVGFYLIQFFVHAVLQGTGSIPQGIDYALSALPVYTLAYALGIFLAGGVGEVVAYGLPAYWGYQSPLRPSPLELSLQNRILYILIPVILILALFLTITGWRASAISAQKLLEDQMESAARLAGDSVPGALAIGHSLILKYANDARLASTDDDIIRSTLVENFREASFFTEFLLVLPGEPPTVVAHYPESAVEARLTSEEIIAVKTAESGVTFQYYAIQPETGSSTARLTMIATSPAIPGRVLIGRSNLEDNLYFQPTLMTLSGLQNAPFKGTGILLNEERKVLFNSSGGRLLEQMPGIDPSRPTLVQETGLSGLRNLVYTYPTPGYPWMIVITVPTEQLQRLSLTIATPLLGMLMVFSVVVLVLLWGMMRTVTGSLKELAVDANRIAQDQRELGTPVKQGGEDEVGQMRRAFEKMRVSLKSSLDEQQQFLLVSRAIAATLELPVSVKPVLDAVLTTGAVTARLAISPDVFPIHDEATPLQYGVGQPGTGYELLDSQILELSQKQPRIFLTNPARARLLNFQNVSPMPRTLVAYALRHENHYYGVIWLAYDTSHVLTEDEDRFLFTLASQAALAVANASLFARAEVGRQRMEAILIATPDPVLVSDHQHRLLLANPAASPLIAQYTGIGLPIQQVILHPAIVALMTRQSEKPLAEEITINDRHYYTTVTPVESEGRAIGKVCILRDVTNFKELDELKNQLLISVNHDLRSPLTAISGNAKMIRMVGEINPKQDEILQKIINTVDRLEKMVKKLLDIVRIEAGVNIQVEMTSLSEVARAAVEGQLNIAAQKNISVKLDLPEAEAYYAEADPTLMNQAYTNLIENAIKYTRNQGEVTIWLKRNSQEGTITFCVKDTGVGISAVDQPRVFEKFFRVVQQDSDRQQGSGLGLAIVKSIADRHHGKVWFESRLGQGSSFYLEIPIRQPKEGM